MNFYMTSGTYDYLLKIYEKHKSEKLILAQNAEGTVLMHETAGESIFEEPRKYEVIDAHGELAQQGFVVCNNIPVTDEGRPVFEYRFKNRARQIESEPGFISIRVLRPMNSDTYVIMTQWADADAFHAWQDSKAYAKAHEKRGTSEGMDAQKDLFPRASFVTKYSAPDLSEIH
ncbi:antibiotic biosynthesis monooxygenase family protein [Falsibacillus pallidus]|uniref:Heme-degrading monooxygenase HmoA n=1 Tax=Falsibacillus pallidus TaxID=493781 RepID=A0A370GW09_9BACI|nr:antibiotic biosynthesis monooxygenase [Falsibacillus pallidus]RDI47858.1 heme-degrading monooxygenase HmoA [Falsibacillus pallidus]